MRGVHICRFDTTEDIRGRNVTYENIKARVLEVGRFSCFEASSNAKRAAIFTRLMRDPDIERVEMGYPWVGVRRRAEASGSAK